MRLRLNIHYKITLVLTATVAVILAGVYAYLNNHLKENTYQRIKANLERESALASLYLDRFWGPGLSVEQIDKLADQIGGQLELRATIIGPDGKVWGDSDVAAKDLGGVENHFFRPEIQNALVKGLGESRRFSATVQKDMLYMARSFGGNPKKGFIRLAIPLHEVQMISDELKQLLLTALLAAFVLLILIGSKIFTFISGPIKEMATVARRFTAGDYSPRVAVATSDELGELARSINDMSGNIKTRVEEITANKLRFEAVLLSMCEGTMVVDKNGTIMLMNEALKNFFRVDADPAGKKPLEVIRNIEIQETVDRVIKSGESVASQEITILLLSEEKTLQVYTAPVLRNGEIDGAVLVFHDITELKRLENIRRDFVANVSHEIKTPLTSIKGYTETLLDGAMDDREHAKDFLQIIGADANRLVQLVDDLLDLSRIESGKLNLHMVSHSVAEVLGRIADGFRNRFVGKQITIDQKIPDNLPNVNMDEAAVAQVLLNLVDNAVKYSKEQGSVIISAEDNGPHIVVRVADTGIGIPEEDLPRIFERFYRVDKARSRQLGGTGLGLSIVKHIIQAHGGEVFVESRLGQGSIFSFTLPKA